MAKGARNMQNPQTHRESLDLVPVIRELIAQERGQVTAEILAKNDIEESVPHAAPIAAASAPTAKPATIGPLPKLTMYLHRDVIKALKRLAVEDEVQVQDILRTALRDHFTKRGHSFTDLTTGK